MSNHPDLCLLINDGEEEDCLNHLVRLDVQEFDDMKLGYRIHFHFDPNPYFENTVLTKEFNRSTGNVLIFL